MKTYDLSCGATFDRYLAPISVRLALLCTLFVGTGLLLANPFHDSYDRPRIEDHAAGRDSLEADVDAGLTVAWIGPDMARLRCAIQRLEGDVDPGGLTLRSTRAGDHGAVFRIAAEYVGREGGAMVALSGAGLVEVENSVARIVRAGCIEEFQVGIDGIRQDFVIPRSPAGHGLLRLELRLSGARVEERDGRIEIGFVEADRRLSYGRLHVEDATGRRLAAEMTRVDADRIALLVDDATAAYPVRIDPTFSDANWTGLGGLGGADREVQSIVVDESGNVYIGGGISAVGDAVVRRIARWDGSRWSDLGEGLPISVERLLVFEDTLYACGRRVGLSGYQVVKRQGSGWEPVGDVFSDRIEVMKPHLGMLHVAGWFTTVGEKPVNRIAHWDGAEWRPLGIGIGGLVRDILSFEGELYAGGAFQQAGGVTANRVTKWNGTAWSALGTGLSGDVNALVEYDGQVVAGGSFNQAGGSPAQRVARWNGTSWVNIGGMSENFVAVVSLAVAGDTLYAAGNFTQVSGQAAQGLAQLNQTWSAVGTGFRGPAGVVATFGSNLYVGGGSVQVDGFAGSGFSRWDGVRWGTLGDHAIGVDAPVQALAWVNDALYVGGSFRTAGGKLVNGVARWDGSEWHALGAGVSMSTGFIGGFVRAFAAINGDLYVAGSFDRAGDVEVGNIARWDGSSWSALGSGVRGTVEVMAVYDDKLIVGGQISNAGGQFVQNLVQWNGTEWSQVGFGRSSTVRALAVLDGHLYVGGSFFSPESYIARWDGSLFSAVGSGMNSSVGSLLVANGTLYAGGRFTFAGEVAAKHIGQWDGTEWQPLGDGVDLFVSTIATWGGHVVVGGERATSPNVVTPYLVHWDGETWSEAGPGVNGQVDALLAIEDALYAGGEFTTASGQVAAYVAQLGLQIGGPSRIVGIEVAGGSVALRFAGAPRAAYQVVRSPNLGPSQEWLVVTVAPILADDLGAFEFEDVAPLPGAAYYRIEEVAPPTRTSRTKPEHERPLEWHSTTTVPAPSLTTR